MNLSIIDWAIVIIVLAGMIYSVSFTKGLMRSVTDFLSAGRTAGRYLISVSQGAAGLGAISIVSFLEVGYITGFSFQWWGLSQGIILLAITTSGWVIYRFRQTRSLTLAQFFEKRYNLIEPTQSLQKRNVNKSINFVKKGKVKEAEKVIKPVIKYLLKMKCKKIILACTELPVAIFAYKSFKKVKSSKTFFDPNLILAKAAMKKYNLKSTK